jgi:hypothetical protein
MRVQPAVNQIADFRRIATTKKRMRFLSCRENIQYARTGYKQHRLLETAYRPPEDFDRECGRLNSSTAFPGHKPFEPSLPTHTHVPGRTNPSDSKTQKIKPFLLVRQGIRPFLPMRKLAQSDPIHAVNSPQRRFISRHKIVVCNGNFF